jgi:hypothetical protein
MKRCAHEGCHRPAVWEDTDSLQWCHNHRHSLVSKLPTDPYIPIHGTVYTIIFVVAPDSYEVTHAPREIRSILKDHKLHELTDALPVVAGRYELALKFNFYDSWTNESYECEYGFQVMRNVTL